MLVTFVVVAALPLVAMSYLAVSTARDSLKEQAGSAKQGVAQSAADYVDLYVRNAELRVGAYAREAAVKSAITRNGTTELALASQSLCEEGRRGNETALESCFVLDRAGRVLAVYPANDALAGESLALVEAFRGALATGTTFVGQAYESPRFGRPVLGVAAPVFVNGTIRGAVLGNLDLLVLGRSLQSFTTSELGTMYLADASGRVLYHPNESLAAERADVRGVVPVARGLTNESGFAEHSNDVVGGTRLAGFAPLPRLGWVVVNSEPLSVAYFGANRLTLILGLLSATLLGAVLAGSVVMAGLITRPVADLTRAANAISRGELHSRVNTEGGGEEIEGLAKSFNNLAATLEVSIAEIRRSAVRYRSLVESANDLIFTVEPDGRLSFVSPRAGELVGRESSALADEQALALVELDDRLAFGEATARVLVESRTVASLPLRFTTTFGAPRHFLVNLTPVPGPDGRPARVLGVARDVTEARRSDEVRERLFAAARLVSEEGALAPLVARGLELLLEAAGSRAGAAYLVEGDALELTAAIGERRARADETTLAAQAVAERRVVASGESVAVPLVERGEALGCVVLDAPEGAGEDLAVAESLASQLAVGVRRARFEARLREYAGELERKVEDRTAELREKNKEIEAFLYTVSHDLKAPLISIQGYAQALEEDFTAVLGEGGRFYLDRLRRNSKAMERLILDLLELSRVGRLEAAEAPVSLDNLVRDIAQRLADRVAEKRGVIDVQGPLPTITGDARRLEQVFANLLENAVKYSDPSRPLRVTVSAEHAGGEWRVLVADNGLGIPASAKDRLFQMFQRFHVDVETPGTGMGLAIVKRIVEAHGGRVAAESEEGKGTRFVLAFPDRSLPAPPV